MMHQEEAHTRMHWDSEEHPMRKQPLDPVFMCIMLCPWPEFPYLGRGSWLGRAHQTSAHHLSIQLSQPCQMGQAIADHKQRLRLWVTQEFWTFMALCKFHCLCGKITKSQTSSIPRDNVSKPDVLVNQIYPHNNLIRFLKHFFLS